MSSNNSFTERFLEIWEAGKQYIELQKRYTRLEVIEKLSVLLSTLLLVLIISTLGIMFLFYLSFTLAYILEPVVGGLMGSFGIVSILVLTIIAFILLLRKQLIVNPIVKFISGLFSDAESTEK